MEFPSIGSFPRTTTINGTFVILFTNLGGGDYPLLGAMYMQDRWVPAAWTLEGRKFVDAVYHNLNLVIETERLTA